MANNSKISGKTILITGGSGFIGSFLTEHFYKDNKVTLFDNGRRNAFKFLSPELQKEVNLINGDIQDEQLVKKIVKDQQIVIHLAAIAGASSYESDPLLTLSVNLFGTANLLKALVDTKVERVITFSTSEVYGPLAFNVTEEDPTSIGPLSESRWSYAVSKVASDHLGMAYFKKYSLPISMVRPFNIYGPRQMGEGAISNMLTSAIKEKKIYVTGDGLQKRSWCYISDLVTAIELICSSNLYGECFNVGNPNSYVTILDLAKQINKLFPEAKIVFSKGKAVEILKRKPNTDKAKKLLGFNSEVDLEKGLDLTSQWWLENITKF